MIGLISPSSQEIMNNAIDLARPKHGVSIEIRDDEKVIWVCVDGLTLLRICQINKLEVVDNRIKRTNKTAILEKS